MVEHKSKLPEGEYYTVPQLAIQWECTEHDIYQYLLEGKLNAYIMSMGWRAEVYGMVKDNLILEGWSSITLDYKILPPREKYKLCESDVLKLIKNKFVEEPAFSYESTENPYADVDDFIGINIGTYEGTVIKIDDLLIKATEAQELITQPQTTRLSDKIDSSKYTIDKRGRPGFATDKKWKNLAQECKSHGKNYADFLKEAAKHFECKEGTARSHIPAGFYKTL